jgi:TRAP-type C4-dicarboxylate transport system permease small subunit
VTAPDPGSAPAPPGAEPAGPTIEELQRRYGGRLVGWLQLVHLPLLIGAGVVMLGLLAWTVADIVARSVFNNPLSGTVELTELAVVAMVYLGLSYAESRDTHIAVDLLYVRLPVRAQLALRVFAGLVSLVVIAVMTWRLYVYAGQLDAGGYITGILQIPLYPVALLAVLGAATFGLAVLVNTAVSMRALLRRR